MVSEERSLLGEDSMLMLWWPHHKSGARQASSDFRFLWKRSEKVSKNILPVATLSGTSVKDARDRDSDIVSRSGLVA